MKKISLMFYLLFFFCHPAISSSLKGVTVDSVSPEDGNGFDGRAHLIVNLSGAPSDAVISNVKVHYKARSTYLGDLKIYLTSEKGAGNWPNALLWDREGPLGGSLDKTNTYTNFNGYAPIGTWYLTIEDHEYGDTGSLEYFEIEVFYTVKSENQPPVVDGGASTQSGGEGQPIVDFTPGGVVIGEGSTTGGSVFDTTEGSGTTSSTTPGTQVISIPNNVSTENPYDLGEDIQHAPTLEYISGISACKTQVDEKCLPVEQTAMIKVKISDQDNDLDYLEANCDGSERAPVKVNLNGNGEYIIECNYQKSNHKNNDTSLSFWAVHNLEFSAIAFDKKKNKSTALITSNINIYDRTKYLEILEANKASLEQQDQNNQKAKQSILDDINNITNQKDNIGLQSIVDLYSQNSLNAINVFNLNYALQPKDPCLWLAENNECLLFKLPQAGNKFGHVVDSENSNYPYTVYVSYPFNRPSTTNIDDNYPAFVWLKSPHSDYTIETQSYVANNSSHLRFLVGLLIDDVKNTIDAYSGIDTPLNDAYQSSLYLKDTDILPLTSNSDFDTQETDRFSNALTKAYDLTKDEIESAGKKSSKSLSIVLDSNQPGLVRAENGTRYIYQLGLGTLKAGYSILGGLIYGSAENEINDAISAIGTTTEEQFHKLSDENQAAVLKSIAKANAVINDSEESRALFETALYGIGGKYVKSTGGKANKIIKRQIVVVKKALIPTTARILERMIAQPFKLFINEAKFIQYGRKFILKEDVISRFKVLLENVKKGKDPKGKILGNETEIMANNVFQKLLGKDFVEKKGSYYGVDVETGKHGFDGVFIQGTFDKPIKIVIVESKQLHNGAAQLSAKTATNPAQMSVKWIDKVAKELIKLGGDKGKLGQAILDNPKLIDKFVTGIHRTDFTLEVIKIK